MYCGQCGQGVAAGNRFCTTCGSPITATTNPPSTNAENQTETQSQWLHETGAKPDPTVAAGIENPLARAAYTVLAPYGLTSLEDARQSMPSDQYDHILREAQDLAVRHTHHANRSHGYESRARRPIAGQRPSGSATSHSAVPGQNSPLALTVLILGVLLGIAFLWRGWDIYHAGQVINNATNLLGGLLGSQGQQATSFLNSLTGSPDDYELAGQAIMLAGIVCVVGAAFAASRPRVSMGAFGLAALLAFSVTGSGAGDIAFFGVAAAVLGILCFFKARRRA